MSKWNWAFGSVSIPKFRWAVTSGDQTPQSEDDKKCGDHYIDKNLECHDGDAHRPDPGNNPYFQGGRKGPPGEDADGKGKSEDGTRDRREVTKKAKKKEDQRAKEGTPSTPERMAKFAEDTLNDFMDDYGDVDWDSDHGQKLLNELAEMAIRETAREHAGQLDQRAAKKYLPGRDHEDNRPDPGVGPREMFRPGLMDKPITFEAPEHGTPVKVPKAPGESVFRDLIDRARSDRGQKQEETEPDRKGAVEHTKKKNEKEQSDNPVEDRLAKLGPDKKKQFVQWLNDKAKTGTVLEDDVLDFMDKNSMSSAESALASALNWSLSKIMMDRADPKPGDPGCPSEDDLLALDAALPPLPGDSAEGRPCGEGEDPERGHCKGPGGPGMQTGPMSDDPKTLRKMGGPPGGGGKPPAPPKGVGLEIQDDPQRKARTATHIQVMKNSDPKDPKRTSWALNKMFGGGAVKNTPKGMGGSSKPMAEKLARQQYDDARHTMEQSGWQETSNMGNRTTWGKGGANITMQTGPSGNTGQYTNQFLVHTPKAAPKKRGLFGR